MTGGLLRWNQGRTTIDALIDQQRLVLVEPNRDHAMAMIEQARTHLVSARSLRVADPIGAFNLAYDAAKKSLAAILANEGIRAAGGEGGHAVLLQVALAQLDPPKGAQLREFTWMRQLRNDSSYPSPETPVATADDVTDALPAAAAILDIAVAVIPQMPRY